LVALGSVDGLVIASEPEAEIDTVTDFGAVVPPAPVQVSV